ncbi:hypothetical protein BJY04DRAFT_188109 [Aspergillus karnatakaensis]|uniref:Zn(II)2Cys6 transcription factor domain-containing protein n=1 Tax=Aspergillus karnatakaensis TaxID=1810916 RepID=UPI003CCE30EB
MAVTPPAPLKRAPYAPLKSRRGCKTCKARKVKCGEEKPHCLRCSSTGRKCEYAGTAYGTYSSAPAISSVISTANKTLSLLPNTVARERRAFAYYFQHAAPLVGGLDADFWSNIVPQVCVSEPAVWDAIISISTLFECHDQPVVSGNYRDALAWYSRAVSAVRVRLERGGMDVFVGLISCVLFICIEALQGGIEESLRLYAQGVHLILALREQVVCGTLPSSDASLLEETIVPIFMRLGVIASGGGVSIGKLLRDPGHHLVPGFVSLKAARESIIRLTAEVQIFQTECEEHHESSFALHPPQEILGKQAILSASLAWWRKAFTNLMEQLPSKNTLTPDQIGTSALLLCYYETLYVLVGICTSPIKSITDRYLAHFQQIVEQSRIALLASARADGSQPPFTFDIGVAFPLLVVSLRCSDSRTRRNAIALMSKAPQVQGFYGKPFAIAFSQKIMEIEESLALALRGSSGVIESIMPATPASMDGLSHYSHSPGNHSDGSIDTTRTPNSHPDVSLMLTGADIPEEARIKPYGIFKPRDGIPPITPVEEVMKWNVTPDQDLLQYSRTIGNPEARTWHTLHECAPIYI